MRIPVLFPSLFRKSWIRNPMKESEIDSELKIFLQAVGRRDLEIELSDDEVRALRLAMKDFSASARLAHAIADRPDRTELYRTLADELANLSESPALDVFERTGISEVLDQHGPFIVSKLTSDDVPPEDLEFLRECGIKDAGDEVVITLTRFRAGYWPMSDGKRVETTEIVRVTKLQMQRSAEELTKAADAQDPRYLSTKKPRKYFNGIGKILSGVVAGTGNVLIGAGVIPATGGAVAAGIIASAAASIGIVMQGIGDLKGE